MPQRENLALRQHVLDLRRAARAAGLQLNESATFLPIPVGFTLPPRPALSQCAAHRAQFQCHHFCLLALSI